MRLSDLAEVRFGFSWNGSLRHEGGPNDVAYLEANAKEYRYIPFKEARKISPTPYYLQYADYLLYKDENEFKLRRFEETGAKRTLANASFVIIRPELTILSEFFAHTKNRTYFYDELLQKSSEGNAFPTLNDLKNIEIFTDNVRELETQTPAENLGINQPVDLSQVHIIQKPLPMDKLIKRIKNDELLLDTDFQRRPGLWDLTTQSRFIESMLARLPVPAFYFDGSNDDKWLVIDGLQRLSTVRAYLEGQFGLQDLVFMPESFIGKTFNDLERAYQRNIEEYEVFAYIIQKAPPSVKYKLFRNINTGALRLEPQEIRHTVNPGKPAGYLKNIASSEWFRSLVPMGDRARDRMDDREAVLRFITFRRLNAQSYQSEGSVVEMLDKSMTQLYDLPEIKLREHENELRESLETIHAILGEEPFSRTMFDAGQRTVSHNSILFELLACGFAKLTESQRAELTKRKEDVASKIKIYFQEKTRTVPRFWDLSYAYSKEGIRRFDDLNKFLATL